MHHPTGEPGRRPPHRGVGWWETLLTWALLQELDPENTEIALLLAPPKTAEGCLRKVIYQLGEDEAPGDRTQIVHRIREILLVHHSNGRETILVIDEGQHPDEDSVLEEIQLLLNF